MRATARTWRLNPRAALLAGLGALVAAGLALGLARGRGDRDAKALMAQAEARAAAGDRELAVRYLDRALELAPGDADAHDRRSALLALGATTRDQLAEAVAAGDRALRLDPDRPDARRRLAALHLRLADEGLADGRGRGRAAAEARGPLLAAPSPAAADLRLGARAWAAQAAGGDKSARPEAVRLAERARDLEPGDIDGAERLAALYAEAGDPARAARSLAELVRAVPTARAHLARYRHHAARARAGSGPAAAGEARDAADALARAATIAPGDVEVRLAAAGDALERGDTVGARRHLDRLPPGGRDDRRARFARGMIDLAEDRREQAVDTWRAGLLAAGGGDAELSWRLAYVLIQLGRLDEAAPLVDQYRRLSGGERPAPAHRFLVASTHLRRNHPAAALAELDQARPKLAGTAMGAQADHASGLAREALRDELGALADYQRAAEASPRWSAPRLARARILRATRPEEADAELARAAAEDPGDPATLIAVCRAEHDRQAALPAHRARWATLSALLERARALAPTAAGLVAVEADYLASAGRPEEAAARLEQATRHDRADARLWVARAAMLARLGRPDDALLTLEQAAAPEAAGDQASIRVARAKLLTRAGHGRRAREQLGRDLDRLPPEQRPLVHMALGDLHAAQRRPAEARKAYAAWADLLPDDPLPRLFLLELALAEGDAPGVDAGIAALRAGGRETLYSRVGAALKLLRQPPGADPAAEVGRLAEAERLIEMVRGEAPQRRHAYLLEGQLWERRGRPERAVVAYEDALKHDGGPAAIARLAALYTRLKRTDDLAKLTRDRAREAPELGRAGALAALRGGDADRAARLASMVAEADPEDLDARLWQARVLDTLDRPEEAEAALRALAKSRPEAASPRLALLYLLVGRGRWAEARTAAAEVRRSPPRVARPELLAAGCARLAGDLPAARALYAEALALAPTDPAVAHAAANFLEADGRPGEAEACLSATQPMPRWASRSLALILAARGVEADLRRAEALVGEGSEADEPEDRLARGLVLARDPDPSARSRAAEALVQLAEDLPADLPTSRAARRAAVPLLADLGHPARAAELARPDAERPGADPRDVLAHAEALRRAGDLAGAERQADRLDELAPPDLPGAELRARLLAARGHGPRAAAPVERAFGALGGGPDGPALGREAARFLLHDLRLVEAAERVARAMAERWPGTAGVLGTVLAASGRAAEAMAQYKAAALAADAPGVLEAARNALALAAAPGADPAHLALAEEVMDAALRREPRAPELLAGMGRLRHIRGDYGGEVRYYEDALAQGVRDHRFLNNLAWTLSEHLGRPAEALGRVDEALARAGRRDPGLLDTRGVIYARLGRHDRAIADLAESAAARPSPATYAHLARSYHAAGRAAEYEEARARALRAGLRPEMLNPADRDATMPLFFPGRADGPAPASPR